MKDFQHMTADEIKAYRGEVYRATVKAVRKGQADQPCVYHDFNSTGFMGLSAKIADLARDWHICAITYGPHTADAGRVVIEDAQPAKSMNL